ncbi:MAG: hypothetical protein KGJ13_00325 [Patescibacteria group bacterium]|nr:hypothetical protein [Patescibacteria group bacterium]
MNTKKSGIAPETGRQTDLSTRHTGKNLPLALDFDTVSLTNFQTWRNVSLESGDYCGDFLVGQILVVVNGKQYINAEIIDTAKINVVPNIESFS